MWLLKKDRSSEADNDYKRRLDDEDVLSPLPGDLGDRRSSVPAAPSPQHGRGHLGSHDSTLRRSMTSDSQAWDMLAVSTNDDLALCAGDPQSRQRRSFCCAAVWIALISMLAFSSAYNVYDLRKQLNSCECKAKTADELPSYYYAD